MTLELLEGSILDLGPEVWALAILAALFLIEVFQLGPHSIFGSGKEKKSAGLRRGVGKKNSNTTFIIEFIRKEVVANLQDNSGNYAFLYVGDETFKLYPEPHAGFIKPEVNTLYPQLPREELKTPTNYVIACGNDPTITVLGQFQTLWSDMKRKKRIRHIVLYSRVIPSTYTIQTIVGTFGTLTKDRVTVSVFYSDDDEEGAANSRLEEKAEYLTKQGISFDKIE